MTQTSKTSPRTNTPHYAHHAKTRTTIDVTDQPEIQLPTHPPQLFNTENSRDTRTIIRVDRDGYEGVTQRDLQPQERCPHRRHRRLEQVGLHVRKRRQGRRLPGKGLPRQPQGRRDRQHPRLQGLPEPQRRPRRGRLRHHTRPRQGRPKRLRRDDRRRRSRAPSSSQAASARPARKAQSSSPASRRRPRATSASSDPTAWA